MAGRLDQAAIDRMFTDLIQAITDKKNQSGRNKAAIMQQLHDINYRIDIIITAIKNIKIQDPNLAKILQDKIDEVRNQINNADEFDLTQISKELTDILTKLRDTGNFPPPNFPAPAPVVLPGFLANNNTPAANVAARNATLGGRRHKHGGFQYSTKRSSQPRRRSTTRSRSRSRRSRQRSSSKKRKSSSSSS